MSHQLDVLRIHPNDNICVALQPLAAGTELCCNGIQWVLSEDVRLGAKLALQPLNKNDVVLKFGEPIGTLTTSVPLGGYIHTHNLGSNYVP